MPINFALFQPQYDFTPFASMGEFLQGAEIRRRNEQRKAFQSALGGLTPEQQLDPVFMAKFGAQYEQPELASNILSANKQSLEQKNIAQAKSDPFNEDYFAQLQTPEGQKAVLLLRENLRLSDRSAIKLGLAQSRVLAQNGSTKEANEKIYDLVTKLRQSSDPINIQQGEFLLNAVQGLEDAPTKEDYNNRMIALNSLIDPEFEKQQNELRKQKVDIAKTDAETKTQEELGKQYAQKTANEKIETENKQAMINAEIASKQASAQASLAQAEATRNATVNEAKKGDQKAVIDLMQENEKLLQPLRENQRKIEQIKMNLADPVTGEPIDMGGAPARYMREFNKFWKGMDDADRDTLIMDISSLTTKAALSLKAPGALSEAEFQTYLRSTPNKDASSDVIAKWISRFDEINKASTTAIDIQNKFAEANGSIGSAKEKFNITVGDKIVTVNKGQSYDDVLKIVKFDGLKEMFTPSLTEGKSVASEAEDLNGAF